MHYIPLKNWLLLNDPTNDTFYFQSFHKMAQLCLELAVVKIKGYGFGYYAASFYVVEWWYVVTVLIQLSSVQCSVSMK